MNTAATIGLINIPQFYSAKQVSSSNQTSNSGTITNNQLVNTSLSVVSSPATEDPNKKLPSLSNIPTNHFSNQHSSQFQTATQHQILLQNHFNFQQTLQNQQNNNSTQQHIIQQRDLVAFNLTRSLINNVTSTGQQQSTINVNNNNNNNLISLDNQQQSLLNQEQPALNETLVQTVPTATSTPNPIQQHQQEIFTNILLKFDPTSLFQKKVAQATTTDQLFSVTNLNTFNLGQMNPNNPINNKI